MNVDALKTITKFETIWNDTTTKSNPQWEQRNYIQYPKFDRNR